MSKLSSNCAGNGFQIFSSNWKFRTQPLLFFDIKEIQVFTKSINYLIWTCSNVYTVEKGVTSKEYQNFLNHFLDIATSILVMSKMMFGPPQKWLIFASVIEMISSWLQKRYVKEVKSDISPEKGRYHNNKPRELIRGSFSNYIEIQSHILD